MEKRRIVLMDFDGVIANSFGQLYEINRLAGIEVNKNLSKNDYLELFKGNIHQKIKEFVGEDDMVIKKFTEFKYKIFSEYYNEKQVSLFDFSVNMIKELANTAELVIISSAPGDSISRILKKNKIDSYFTGVVGINKDGKRASIAKYKDNNNKLYFVTDTVGDLAEVQGLNITSFGVTWGFHNEVDLLSMNPSFLINDYSELVKIVSE